MGLENNIPEGWMETTLGEVALIGSSKRIFFSEYVDKGIPFYRSKEIIQKQKGNNISTELFITEEKYDNLKKNFGAPQENDILLTSVGTLGIPYMVRKNEIFYFKDGNLTWIRDYQNIEPAFLYNWFLSSTGKHQLNKITIGSTQSALTISGLKSIELLLPPINEQIQITNIINAFDDKIELLQAQNKTLETMAQTIFKEWFGKYQIGDELPEGWRVGILDDLFGELETGNRPKGGVGNLSYGIPSIGAESIGGISNFDYSKTKYVSKEFFLNMKRGVVKEYDILIYKDGGTPGTFIPKFSMFGEGFPFKEFCINSHVFRVQPKKIHHRFYIYQLLNSYYCKWQLKNIGGKAAIPGINSTDLKNLDVIIPCDKLLYKYHDLVKNKYKKILKNMVQIQSLTKTRDTLLPKLMSGQVRVNNIKQITDA